VNNLRTIITALGAALAVTMCAGLPVASAAQAQTASTPSIEGGWTLNKSQSDQQSTGRDDQSQGDRGDRSRGGGRSGRGGGYGGRGGFGGRGGMGRGGSGNAPPMNQEDAARQRDAMRDVMNPPDHFVITQTESMVVLTAPDGRTTRLSPDGKKVKDDNTKVERKTKWEGGKLVSEINGLGPSKMTQTFAVDPESHQLRITVQVEGNGRAQARSFTHVYDLDAKQ
jgi:hypothetical protein